MSKPGKVDEYVEFLRDEYPRQGTIPLTPGARKEIRRVFDLLSTLLTDDMLKEQLNTVHLQRAYHTGRHLVLNPSASRNINTLVTSSQFESLKEILKDDSKQVFLVPNEWLHSVVEKINLVAQQQQGHIEHIDTTLVYSPKNHIKSGLLVGNHLNWQVVSGSCAYSKGEITDCVIGILRYNNLRNNNSKLRKELEKTSLSTVIRTYADIATENPNVDRDSNLGRDEKLQSLGQQITYRFLEELTIDKGLAAKLKRQAVGILKGDIQYDLDELLHLSHTLLIRKDCRADHADLFESFKFYTQNQYISDLSIFKQRAKYRFQTTLPITPEQALALLLHPTVAGVKNRAPIQTYNALFSIDLLRKKIKTGDAESNNNSNQESPLASVPMVQCYSSYEDRYRDNFLFYLIAEEYGIVDDMNADLIQKGILKKDKWDHKSCTDLEQYEAHVMNFLDERGLTRPQELFVVIASMESSPHLAQAMDALTVKKSTGR
jgi:hypothetical protein